MRLKCAGIAVFSRCDIENDHMGVKLGRGISIHWTATVMLKLCSDPSARCFWRMVSANARLNVSLQLVERQVNRLAVGHAHTFISPHQRRQRNALRRTERRIPSSSMFHAVDGLTFIVHVLITWAVTNQVCPGNRVLSIGKPGEVFFLHLAFQSPLFRQLAVPLASNSLAFGVVIVLGVGKLPLVITECA